MGDGRVLNFGRDDDPIACTCLCKPVGSLVLTSTVVRCVDQSPDQPSTIWEVQLEQILLVQQRGCCVQLLVLHETSSFAQSSAAFSTFEVVLQSSGSAARLHEVLRIAGLNARGKAMVPPPPGALIRSTCFVPSVSFLTP